ncbi:FmdE family protein [Methanobrevibacter filiformis]|uniref:FmdE, molybdenum formylmethanofuran dehydrogenase operon n=1 Tax=Methanobrevibacter filiformis TaxID=55758 RepID=A0A162FKX7_9EURY|nr:FmdE family protein [Methanobrevibacter filiformis]KZX11550.1 FmdE, molybdenum formylmethanofuran dehydrogenase operon [Methanobrevibacter filiformis]
MVNVYEEQLEKAGKFHGDICGGIVSGTKMTVYALELLGMEFNKKNKDLIVFLEIDRCMSDAVQAVTGCSLGKRSLKLVNYGRFAASFYKISTKEAIRLVSKDDKEKYKDETTKEKIERYKNTPSDELFEVQPVEIKIPEEDMPGKPIDQATCSVCGERIMDGKHKFINGQAICKSCSDESYYKIK